MGAVPRTSMKPQGRINPYAAGGLFDPLQSDAYGYSYESTQRGLSNEYQHDRV